MWRLIAVVLALSGLAGCGGPKIGPLPDHGPFEEYFQRFIGYAKKHGRDVRDDEFVKIEFGEVDGQNGEIAGQCQWNAATGSRIVMVKKEWDTLTEGTREALLFHELGHCILKREHEPNQIWSREAGDTMNGMEKIPKSLMRPEFLTGGTYLQFQEYYLKELFGN